MMPGRPSSLLLIVALSGSSAARVSIVDQFRLFARLK
jgi:hypothetical protein